MTTLNVGDVVPSFTALSAQGTSVSLADFAGKSVVLYVYPAAMTPGCTKQACDFRDSYSHWINAGFEVVGLSPDKPEKLQKFEATESLPFTLLSDPDKSIMTSLGAFGEKKLYGKIVVGVIRSTFVIDVDAAGVGVVRHAWYNVKATGHVAKISRELGLSIL